MNDLERQRHRKSVGNELIGYLKQADCEEGAEIVENWIEEWAEE